MDSAVATESLVTPVMMVSADGIVGVVGVEFGKKNGTNPCISLTTPIPRRM